MVWVECGGGFWVVDYYLLSRHFQPSSAVWKEEEPGTEVLGAVLLLACGTCSLTAQMQMRLSKRCILIEREKQTAIYQGRKCFSS